MIILDSFIMEEYEKADRMVPEWKVNWVKHIIKSKSIIVKDDAIVMTTEGRCITMESK